jgi:hypothetical protein
LQFSLDFSHQRSNGQIPSKKDLPNELKMKKKKKTIPHIQIVLVPLSFVLKVLNICIEKLGIDGM